jgi:retron-type reverse transcriptase
VKQWEKTVARQYPDPFQSIADFDALWQAFARAARGKRRNPEVTAFEFNLERELLDLERELRDGSYRPGPYREFEIHDPKRRRIAAAPFRDRVVHHALIAATNPVFERCFVAASYACRDGLGTHAALDRAQQLARRFRYVLQCDIEQFFP